MNRDELARLRQPINPDEMRTRGRVVLNNVTGYRDGVELPIHHINIVFTDGGLGDYINQMSAIEWMANENPHLTGTLFVLSPFDDVARYILRDSPHWSITTITSNSFEVGVGELLINPATFHKYSCAVGTHLLDLGFMYYANMNPPPDTYNRLPDLSDYVSGKDWKLPENYAVFTPGYTVKLRSIHPQAFNTMVKHTIAKGITPVFLGKRDFAGAGQFVNKDYHTKIDGKIDLNKGIDLRERTTLLESVEIMKNARFVCGIDNGLLHFAGCTDVPIIFGFNVTTINHRVIRRPLGTTINLTVKESSLPCIGCQSRTRFLIGHDYKNCMYNDIKCLDILYQNNAEIWIDSINEILDKGNYDCRQSHHVVTYKV